MNELKQDTTETKHVPTDALEAAGLGSGSLERVVRERTCMVINDTELCEHEATLRVKSDKHRFDMLVCALHAKPFIGMSGCKVEPLSNVPMSGTPKNL